MLKVGLTGSIAVGKSFVCEVLRELGAAVLDADQTAREVVAPGSQGLREIAEKFGKDVLLESGELDRARMGAIVFADESKRRLLNSIVHPLVFAAQDRWLAAKERENPRGIAVIDAALMIESGGYKRFPTLIVVWCQPAVQLQRLMLRNDLSEAEALRRIAAQMPQEEKKRYADFLIDTTDGFDAARVRTVEVFEALSLLSK
ncbi:MAG: dephospho-CoA kinase [Acidobacteria bacterium]|nr:dephospho-CoA kinase [Acidobacteriota bacterium]